MKRFFSLVISIMSILLVTSYGVASEVINYQGMLLNVTDGSSVNGSVEYIEVRYYDVADGGIPLCTIVETHLDVSVTNGFFSIELGSVVPFCQNLLDHLSGQDETWIGMTISPDVFSSDGEMNPRLKITDAAKAIRVESIDGAREGTIGDALTIDDYGNVGVGTTSPEAMLHIEGQNPRLRLIGTDGSVNAGYEIFASTPNGKLLIEDITSDGGYRFVIDEEGKIGIGATEPEAMLHIEGLNPRIRLVGNDGSHTAGYEIFASVSNGKFFIEDTTIDGGYRLTIDETGRDRHRDDESKPSAGSRYIWGIL